MSRLLVVLGALACGVLMGAAARRLLYVDGWDAGLDMSEVDESDEAGA